jgi:SAM-dependent methyltransferase
VFRYDAASQTFTLPPEHAVCLTGSTAQNLAPRSQMSAMLAARLPKVAECFRTGGGVPFTEYRPDFTRFQDINSRRRHDTYLLDGYLPAVPGILERLEEGISVADIGCGTGRAVIVMASRFPRSRFIGYDIAADAIALARDEASGLGLDNADFEVLNVAQLPGAPARDLITAFDAIHDQVDPSAVLRRIYEALTPDGTFLMVDDKAASNLEENISRPRTAYSYATSLLFCMTVSLAEGGAGLGRMWGEQLARRMLAEAGFRRVEVSEAPDDRNSRYVCWK